MAKKPQPWFWEARNHWYVKIGGERKSLGPHPEAAPPPKKGKKGVWNSPPEIDAAFRELLSAKPATPDGETVQAVFQAFMRWCRENRAALTASRYQEFLEDFINFAAGDSQVGLLPVSALHTGHVTDWLDAKGWNPTTKRNAITALKRAFNWGCKNKGLKTNPIAGMEKPQAVTRMDVVTPQEFKELLPLVLSHFRDLLVVTYDCGARPQEVKNLEARHLELGLQRAVLPTKEAKGKRRPRVIYFPTERSIEILTQLARKHPEGPLFRNARGNRWTGNAVKCAFARLEEKVGKRLTQYQFRRTWITRKIIAGVDSHVVAQLSGHSSTDMIDRHYSAVAKDHAFLLEQAKRDVQT